MQEIGGTPCVLRYIVLYCLYYFFTIREKYTDTLMMPLLIQGIGYFEEDFVTVGWMASLYRVRMEYRHPSIYKGTQRIFSDRMSMLGKLEPRQRI